MVMVFDMTMLSSKIIEECMFLRDNFLLDHPAYILLLFLLKFPITM